MILDDLHLTVRQLASLLDISIWSMHTLFFDQTWVFLMCVLGRFCIYSYYNKKRCVSSVPISDRVGSQWQRLFEPHNRRRWDMDLLLRSHIQATDEQMGSIRFFLPAKTTCHNWKWNARLSRSSIGKVGYTYTLCQMASRYKLVCQSSEVVHYMHNMLHKWPHYCNGQWKRLYHDNSIHTQRAACLEFLDLAWCRSDSSYFLHSRLHTLWFFPVSYR